MHQNVLVRALIFQCCVCGLKCDADLDAVLKTDDNFDRIAAHLYRKYLEAFHEDNSSKAAAPDNVRRNADENEARYKVHVEKLKPSGGMDRQNIVISKPGGKPRRNLVYINNPVESNVLRSYIDLEDFKRILVNRVQRLDVTKAISIAKTIPSKAIKNTYTEKSIIKTDGTKKILERNIQENTDIVKNNITLKAKIYRDDNTANVDVKKLSTKEIESHKEFSSAINEPKLKNTVKTEINTVSTPISDVEQSTGTTKEINNEFGTELITITTTPTINAVKVQSAAEITTRKEINSTSTFVSNVEQSTETKETSNAFDTESVTITANTTATLNTLNPAAKITTRKEIISTSTLVSNAEQSTETKEISNGFDTEFVANNTKPRITAVKVNLAAGITAEKEINSTSSFVSKVEQSTETIKESDNATTITELTTITTTRKPATAAQKVFLDSWGIPRRATVRVKNSLVTSTTEKRRTLGRPLVYMRRSEDNI